MLTISSLTREYVRVSVAARENGVAVNPTGDTVQLAFVTPGTEPGSSDWRAAVWEVDATTSPATYYARCLVSGTGGGGTAELAEGTYAVWLKLTDTPEIPVREVGRLTIT